MSKRILLTGAGGFVGSHCVEYFLDNTDWYLVLLDSFRHKGTHRRLEDVVSAEKLKRYQDRFIILKHDLTVPIPQPLENLILDVNFNAVGEVSRRGIDYIFNLASDSAVERSLSDPGNCWRNNCELILNMLEFARKIKPTLFLHCSTDEVYGEATVPHKEWSTILPSNVYAASKAAQEALAISYWRSFNVPVVICNIMNMIGHAQDPEKFLPKIIQSVMLGKEIPIYADKDKIGSRVYLHAYNLASALIHIVNLPISKYPESPMPSRWNVCGDTELNNLEMAQFVADLLKKPLKYKLVESESARPGYDRRYLLDGSALHKAGWKPVMTFQESVQGIVDWTLANPHWIPS